MNLTLQEKRLIKQLRVLKETMIGQDFFLNLHMVPIEGGSQEYKIVLSTSQPIPFQRIESPCTILWKILKKETLIQISFF